MARLLTFRNLKARRSGARIKRIRTVSQRSKEGKRALGFVVAILVCALGLLYIFQINNMATKGYEVEDYEKKLSSVKKENQKMMVRLADLESMYEVESKTKKKLQIVNPNDITYITSSSSVVAME
jgi:cell division protein FtsB